MKYFQETTTWDAPGAVNHIYYLNDERSKMVGYIRHGTTELFKFKSPISFYTKGRKFKLIGDGEPDSVYFGAKTVDAPVAEAVEVVGSGGKVYYVTKRGANYLCTCSGFQFRHKCRHVEQIKAEA
jgi:hypothetical protein